jgi:peptidoglycan hydrolase CwlO-like protein
MGDVEIQLESTILDVQDGDFSCAKFLWATWKAHETMASYVHHQFYEHPSIAAVLARHLVDNHVKPDEAASTKINNLDKAVKSINARLDSVQSTADRVSGEVKTLTSTFTTLSNTVNTLNSTIHHNKGKKKDKDKDNKGPKQ